MTRRSGSGILLNSSSRRFCTSGIFLVSGQNKSSSIKRRFYLLLYFYCVLLLSPLRSVLGILPPTGRKDSFNFLVKPWTVNKQLFSRKWQCLKNSLRVNTNRFIISLRWIQRTQDYCQLLVADSMNVRLRGQQHIPSDRGSR